MKSHLRNQLFSVFVAFTFPLTAKAELTNFHLVTEGLYRGAKPTESHDYAVLKASYGIKTLIDLRLFTFFTHNEEVEAHKHEMNYLNIPLNGLGEPDPQIISEILNHLIDPQLQPIYVHCHFGEDRTGLVIALYRVHFQGWSEEEAEKEMLAYGFHQRFLPGLFDFFLNHLTPASLPGLNAVEKNTNPFNLQY
jgi:protein tyrosine/serine phosphatase